MPLPVEHVYTIEDICNLPDGKRAELIDGNIYYMAPPSRTHQRILNYINTRIYKYIEDNNGSCEVNIAPFAVFLDDLNYLEPDISVVCDTEKLNDKGCMGAPDWIIEIVSPGSKRMDYFIKLFKYERAGVKEYWIVDPDKQCITVYDFKNKNIADYAFNANIKAGIYEDLYIDFSETEKFL